MVGGGEEASHPDGRGTSASWYASSLIALAAAAAAIISIPSFLSPSAGKGCLSRGWMVTTLSNPTHNVLLFPDVYKSSQNNTFGNVLPFLIPGLMANLRKSFTQLNLATFNLCRLGKTMVDIVLVVVVWESIEAAASLVHS